MLYTVYVLKSLFKKNGWMNQLLKKKSVFKNVAILVLDSRRRCSHFPIPVVG